MKKLWILLLVMGFACLLPTFNNQNGFIIIQKADAQGSEKLDLETEISRWEKIIKTTQFEDLSSKVNFVVRFWKVATDKTTGQKLNEKYRELYSSTNDYLSKARSSITDARQHLGREELKESKDHLLEAQKNLRIAQENNKAAIQVCDELLAAGEDLARGLQKTSDAALIGLAHLAGAPEVVQYFLAGRDFIADAFTDGISGATKEAITRIAVSKILGQFLPEEKPIKGLGDIDLSTLAKRLREDPNFRMRVESEIIKSLSREVMEDMARPIARRFLDRYTKFIESLARKQGQRPSPSSPSTMPSISSISPNSTKAGQFTLTINGSYFDPGAVDQLYTPSGQYMGSGVQFGRLISRSPNQIVVGENLTNAQAGIYTIRVRNSDGKLSNPINIVVTAIVQTISPIVSMTPPSGAVGTTFTQIGKDFSPNSTVTLHSRKPDGSVWQITTVTTDSTGSFSRTWKAETPGNNLAWWAVDNATGKKGNELVYTVTTVTGTPSTLPPYFSDLNNLLLKNQGLGVGPKWGEIMPAHLSPCPNKQNTGHTGIDIPAKKGTPVYSPIDGEIIHTNPGGTGGTINDTSIVSIYSEEPKITFYFIHLETISVQPGRKVKVGEQIGTVGSRGISTGPHLHFEARRERITTAALCWDQTIDPYSAILEVKRLASVPKPPLPPSGCTASVSSDRWKGEYFNNKSLMGSPSMIKDDGTEFLNFDWGTGSPSTTCGIGSDNFSARWTRAVYFDAGTWRFSVTADDGVRFYVDGSLKIDKWFDQPATTYTVDVPLSAGNHPIKMEYYESGAQAVAKLSWQKITTVTPPISPTVSMSPPSGTVGTTFTQIGRGFSQNATVTLHGRRPDGSVWQINTVRTDSSGAFSHTWTAQTPGNNFAWWAVDNATGKKSNEVTYNVMLSTPQLVEGTLIRLPGQPQVYLIQGGKKCYIPDQETFNANRFRWDQVKEVSQSTFDNIPMGSPLPKQTVTPPTPPPPPLADSQKMKEKLEELVPTLKRFPSPEVTRIEPSSGAPGITIKIFGNHLNPQGAVLHPRVIFEAPYRARATGDIVPPLSNNELAVIVPGGSGTVDVHVETVGGSSNKHRFTYLSPVIKNIHPESGECDQEVTINGENFGIRRSLDIGTFVKFGNSLAKVIQWEDRQIVVKVPSDYGTGLNDAKFVKTLLDLAMAGLLNNEKVISLIRKIAPYLIPKLMTIQLKEGDPWWKSFGKIMFALGIPGVEVLPDGYMQVAVTVTTPAGQTNGLFKYELPKPTSSVAAPQIASISPTQVQAGRFTLTINGSNFDSGAVDQFYTPSGQPMGSGVLSGDLISRSTNQIVVRENLTGAPAGTYSIRVKNSDGKMSSPVSISVTAVAPPPPPPPPTCTDGVQFVADVTIPDGTQVQSGQRFTKTWRLRNSGTCSWGSGYSLVFVGGSQMGAPSSVSVPSVSPTATGDISVSMAAPSASGVHQGYWQMRNSKGQVFGPQIWVKIHVAEVAVVVLKITSISPPQVQAGQFTLTISGSSFDSGAIDQFYTPSGQYMASGAQSGGLVSRSSNQIVVRENLTGAQPGTYTIRVKNSDEKLSNPINIIVTAATVTISPTVSMSPQSGSVGTNFAQTGRGFTPNNKATLYGRRSDGSVWQITTLTTDSSGAFSQTWTAQTPGNNFAWWAVDSLTGKKSNEVVYNIIPPISTNLPPNPPAQLSQLRSDGVTGIGVGATTNEKTVVFKAGVSDPNNDTVKLQIELRRLDEYGGQFTGSPTQESSFVSSGSVATITVYGLINGSYHWRARTIDSKGATSNWLSAGNNPDSAADFAVSVGVPPPPPPPPTCTDGVQFVADVTIPDGTQMPHGQGFTKTWRLRNTGTCSWGSGYSLVFVSGSQMGAPASVSVAPTSPNGTADISVTMTAPSTPGIYQGNWQMRNLKGQPFGTPIYVKINVASTPPLPPPPVCTDGAQFVADVAIPDGTQMQPGQKFAKIWRLKNTGTCAWGSGYSLVFVGGSQMGASGSVPVLPTSINGTTDIGVPMVAPPTPGIHQGHWQMRNPKGQAFGPQIWVKINVASAPSTLPPTPTPPPPKTVPQSISARIDDYAPRDPNNPVRVQVGGSTPLSVSFTNTGNTAWRFIVGASVWDSKGKVVGDYSTTLSAPLQLGQQTSVSWSHPVREAGDYWVQFGVWKAAPFVGENLLEKKPAPAQKLIVGVKK